MKLPLHDIHKAAGATFMDFMGWQIVQTFSSVESEYWALQKSAGLVDLSCSGTFELKGDDRTRFLHGMVTNDIKVLTPGAGCYAAFLSPQGRMITDLRIFCTEESFILSTEPAGREKLVPALRKYIIGDRPLLVDRSEEMGLLSLQGPKAGSLLANVLSQPQTLEHPYDHCEAVLAGARTRICRVDRTEVVGYDLMVERQALPLIWDLILENGKDEVRPVGFESFDAHRIEAGIPWFGMDMDENTLPIEAGLEKSAISFNKGCYIGQESVARITYRGHVNRKLAGLKLSDSHAASRGDKISKDDHEVGWITSSRFSPGLNTAIALGYLRREVLEPGTAVFIEHENERRNGQVTPLPFIEVQASGP